VNVLLGFMCSGNVGFKLVREREESGRDPKALCE